MHLLITDCDGVLTDNKIPRRFSISDGYIPDDYKVLILTSAKDITETEHRAATLGIEVIQANREGKLDKLLEICKRENKSIHEVIYIGDDLQDVGCLRQAGLSFAPKDATRQARKAAGIVLKTKGGDGVLKEVFSIIERRSLTCK